jgi:hypothetical protein
VTNFSETHWGDAEVYALFRALGMDMLMSFRVWYIAGFALTYVAAFVSLRSLGLRTMGAAVGAFLFTFCLPISAQVGHAQLVYRLWVPPAVVALHRFLTCRSLRSGAACVLFVALQLAASVYLGVFLCLLLAAYAAALGLVARDRFAMPLWSAFRTGGAVELFTAGILFAVGLIVLAIVMMPYFYTQSMYGFARSWEDVAGMLPRPGSYLLSGPSELWPNLSARFPFPYVLSEHQIFPGLSAIIPLAWFALSKPARIRQPLAAAMLVTIAILLVVTLDLNGYTLYRLIYLIPGFSAIRAVTRVILIMMFPLATLLGMLIDDIAAARLHHLPRWLLALALSVFLVAECSLVGRYSSSPSTWRARLNALEALLPKKPPSDAVLAIATEPEKPGFDWPWILTQMDASLAAVTLGVSTLNGYSGSAPPNWKVMTTCRDIGDNLRAGRHFWAEHGTTAPAITQSRLVLVGFDSCDPVQFTGDPAVQLGHTYYFGVGADGNQFLGDGFSDPESWGRWTDDKNAFLFFSLGSLPSAPLSIAVAAASMSSAADRKQAVNVIVNGQACGQLVVTASRPLAAVTCPAGAFRTEYNMLRLGIARPARPIDVGVNEDRRLLGLGLIALTLMPKE